MTTGRARVGTTNSQGVNHPVCSMGSKSKKRGSNQHPGSFEDVFDQPSFDERFNRDAALSLKRHPASLLADDGQSNAGADKVPVGGRGQFKSMSPLQIVESLLKRSNGGDSVSTTYAKAQNDVDGDSRWYAQGAVSMQHCPSKLRATLCDGVMIDLDVENAGPTILAQLCAQLGIECPVLDDYVKHREERLSEIYYDREKTKALMIRLTHGGGIHAGEVVEKKAARWVQSYIEEIKKTHGRIAALSKYAVIKERLQHKDTGKGLLPPKTQNIDAKVVSAVLLPLENAALEQFYYFFKNAGILRDNVCVLLFDGLMLSDTESNREHLTEDLLFKATQSVKEQTGLHLKIRIKPFKDKFDLPADYDSIPENFFVVDANDDARPAEILRNAAGDRIVRCHGRYFFNRSGCIYAEGKDEVTEGIMRLTQEVSIVYNSGEGKTSPYSNNTKKVNGAMPRILCDETIRDDAFVDKMWDKNLGFLAFQNGVWSFDERRPMDFSEAKRREIRFIHDTQRAYTAVVDLELKKEVQRRIFDGFIPDAEKQKHYLNALARGLAGKIVDKRWNYVTGERFSSKSLQINTLSRAFGSFVKKTNGDNLLVKAGGGCQDMAKAQNWMVDFEFARIVSTSEMPQHGENVIDGEIIKRICSNGDWVTARKLFKNEVQIRTQPTFFLYGNSTTKISPEDAYETMQGFKVDLQYHDQSEFDDKEEQGIAPPSTWRLKDPSIDEFVRRDDVLDAVTAIIFEAYTSDKQTPPPSVRADTDSIKGPASVSVEDSFAAIIVKDEKHDFLSYPDIQTALRDGGMEPCRGDKVDTLVKRVFNIFPQKPSRVTADGRKVQIRGFKGLKINTHFDFGNPNPDREDME